MEDIGPNLAIYNKINKKYNLFYKFKLYINR